MKFFAKVFFLSLFFFNFFYGQDQKPAGLETFFREDSILLKAGKAFSNVIVLKNTSSSPVKIDSVKAVEAYPGLLFSPSFNERIAANDSQELNVRMIAGKDLLISKVSRVEYLVYSTENGEKKIQKIGFTLLREKMDFVSIMPLGELYYNPASPENLLRIFVENQAYAPRVLKLKIKLTPDDFLAAFPEEQILRLDSKEKQLITVQLKKRQNITYYPDYNLSVSVFDETSNTMVSSVILPIRSLSTYRMVNYDNNPVQYKNYVEASYNNSDNLNTYYKFRTNYEKKIGEDGNIGFNSTVDYYSNTKQTNVYDTRLDLEYSKYSASLGNIYGQNYDFNISGRGLKLGAKVGEKNTVEVLGLENNYMLYSDFSNGVSAGKTAGVQATHLFKSGNSVQLNYVYNQNNFSKVTTNLVNLKTPVYTDSLQVLSFETGLSDEFLDGVNNKISKRGFSSGINYRLMKPKFSLYSNNYYSSPYYSGVRRGSFTMDEMLNYRISKSQNLYIRYNTSNNTSGYLNDMEALGYVENSKFLNHLIEAGWGWNGSWLRVSLAPNYTYQYIRTVYNTLEYQAYRMRVNVGKSLKSHNFNLSWDGGLSQFSSRSGNVFAQRFVFNYSYKFINWSATADINPTNAYDLNWYNGGTFVNYSTSLGTMINAMKNKLNGYFSLGYNFMNSQRSDNLYMNSNIDYKLSPSWSLTGMAYYNFFHGRGNDTNPSYQYSNLQFKVGVKMSLGSSKGNKLTLKIYEDENLNNKIDPDETLVSDAIVKLNQNIVALTNAKGFVKYANLTPGNYTLSVTKNNQRIPLLGLDKLTVKKNTTIEIPVVKTMPLVGQMIQIKDKYDNQKADFMGINIYAQDLKTGKTLVAVTDIDGNFNFQLIEGLYKIYIQNDRYEIVNNNQEIQLKKGETANKLIFNFKNKELKIRKKQF